MFAAASSHSLSRCNDTDSATDTGADANAYVDTGADAETWMRE